MAAMMHSTIITECASKVISALGLLAKIEGLKFHIEGSLRAVFCCFGNLCRFFFLYCILPLVDDLEVVNCKHVLTYCKLERISSLGFNNVVRKGVGS